MGGNETWRRVKGYSDYLVSDKGRVMSLKGDEPKILKPGRGNGRYYQVQLSRKSKEGKVETKTMRIHRLVAEAFIPNPEEYEYVDHVDGDILNNDVKNLRWCTAEMNSNNPITYKKMVKAMHDYWNDNRQGYKARFKVILPGEAVS